MLKKSRESKVKVMQQINVNSTIQTQNITGKQPYECSQSSTKVSVSLKGENHPKVCVLPMSLSLKDILESHVFLTQVLSPSSTCCKGQPLEN
jgi:hypothetical protein